MMNIELQRMLAQLPPTLEVEVFVGNGKMIPLTTVYVGNRGFLPGYSVGPRGTNPYHDSVVLDCAKH